VALAADTQRERALASLRYHYLQGRLDVEELALRADRAVRARTTADLRWALRDLPRLSEALERAKETARLVGFLVVLAALWCVASAFLLLALLVLAFTASGVALLAVPGLWLVLSAALFVAGSRRLRSRR
jgi:hypothetical protein